MATKTAGDAPGANAEERKFLERNKDRLSKSTQRAKWTHQAGEAPDRAGQTLATRSHDVIRAWAEERGAVPATATRGPDGEPRTLRFDFRGEGGNGTSRRLEELSWDDWLGTFDRRELVFIYQENRRDGRQSNFFRLDNPKREDG
jgi:hypothetical protein